MRDSPRLLVLGLIIGVMGALAAPAAASSGWELVEIEPDDGTWCEFEPGSETAYTVDSATLPRFGRWKTTILRELPDGTSSFHIVVQPAPEDRGPVRYLKDDSEAPGPDVLLTTFRANLLGIVSADGETLEAKGTFQHITTTPDGQFVDRNFGRWSGVADDDLVVVRQSGICRP